MKVLAVIPARYSSQRFPGKPLAMIGDKPMIQWVYEAAKKCDSFYKVVVATDSEKIADCVRAFGGDAVMTGSGHQSGTDRVAEAAMQYEEAEIVVNVQGDQPFVDYNMLNKLISPYVGGKLPEMVTAASPLNPGTDYNDPNTVKVVCDLNSNALYFSRAAIPYYRNKSDAPVYHHLGLYAFTRDFLLKYTSFEQTPLEVCEGLEQLRVLEHGYKIHVVLIDKPIIEINTPEDLKRANTEVQI